MFVRLEQNWFFDRYKPFRQTGCLRWFVRRCSKSLNTFVARPGFVRRQNATLVSSTAQVRSIRILEAYSSKPSHLHHFLQQFDLLQELVRIVMQCQDLQLTGCRSKESQMLEPSIDSRLQHRFE